MYRKVMDNLSINMQTSLTYLTCLCIEVKVGGGLMSFVAWRPGEVPFTMIGIRWISAGTWTVTIPILRLSSLISLWYDTMQHFPLQNSASTVQFPGRISILYNSPMDRTYHKLVFSQRHKVSSLQLDQDWVFRPAAAFGSHYSLSTLTPLPKLWIVYQILFGDYFFITFSYKIVFSNTLTMILSSETNPSSTFKYFYIVLCWIFEFNPGFCVTAIAVVLDFHKKVLEFFVILWQS